MVYGNCAGGGDEIHVALEPPAYRDFLCLRFPTPGRFPFRGRLPWDTPPPL